MTEVAKLVASCTADKLELIKKVVEKLRILSAQNIFLQLRVHALSVQALALSHLPFDAQHLFQLTVVSFFPFHWTEKYATVVGFQGHLSQTENHTKSQQNFNTFKCKNL